jgi:hypothetical protein
MDVCRGVDEHFCPCTNPVTWVCWSMKCGAGSLFQALVGVSVFGGDTNSMWR